MHALLVGLRIWLAAIGAIAIISGVQAYVGKSVLQSRIYTAERTCCWDSLTDRLFGLWTVLAGFLRIISSRNVYNIPLYTATVLSFVLAFFHFILEVVVFETASFTVGVILPIFISGVSLIWMCLGLPLIVKNKQKPA
ncbi:ergosterol biosynthetic protein 28 homolog [Oscarella lobularis]|uniref:ergosterol biosynthetic protein 28 homolog n=1 Tax=Oscarella lobularis TaxID=121494 RepID=UPI003313BDBD